MDQPAAGGGRPGQQGLSDQFVLERETGSLFTQQPAAFASLEVREQADRRLRQDAGQQVEVDLAPQDRCGTERGGRGPGLRHAGVDRVADRGGKLVADGACKLDQ